MYRQLSACLLLAVASTVQADDVTLHGDVTGSGEVDYEVDASAILDCIKLNTIPIGGRLSLLDYDVENCVRAGITLDEVYVSSADCEDHEDCEECQVCDDLDLDECDE